MIENLKAQAKKISEGSVHVSISQRAIGEFCRAFNPRKVKNWHLVFPAIKSVPSDSEKALNFLLAFNSISFCYWGAPKWTVEFGGKRFDGTQALFVAIARIPYLPASGDILHYDMKVKDYGGYCLARAFHEMFLKGIDNKRIRIDRKLISPYDDGATAISYKKNKTNYVSLNTIGNSVFTKPGYLASMPEYHLWQILNANSEIPLFQKRLEILHEVGSITKEKFSSNAKNILEEGNGDAEKIVEVIVGNYPSFNDAPEYAGEKIGFCKRAQLVVADFANLVPSQKIKGVEKLTACADYKLPQVLRRRGILEYSEKLSELIDNKVEIKAGSPYEVEIRANTVHAVELIKKNLHASYKLITSNQINDYLWLEGQSKHPDDKPYHLTRTTAY